jgi:hypothetical protein
VTIRKKSKDRMMREAIVPNTLDSPNQRGANGRKTAGHIIINTRTTMLGTTSAKVPVKYITSSKISSSANPASLA